MTAASRLDSNRRKDSTRAQSTRWSRTASSSAHSGSWAPWVHPRGQPSGWQGFGRCPTDTDGRFWFRTVKPGPLPTPAGETEAPHIDVTVLARGMLNRAVTRVYFPDEAANDTDPVLTRVPADRRSTLLAVPEEAGLRFDIRLQGAGETVFFEV